MKDSSDLDRDSLYVAHQDQHLAGARRELVALDKIPREHRREAWNHLQQQHPDKARSLEVLRGVKPDEGDALFKELKAHFNAEIVVYADDLPKPVVNAYRVALAVELLKPIE